jgi:hypothetical protein
MGIERRLKFEKVETTVRGQNGLHGPERLFVGFQEFLEEEFSGAFDGFGEVL